MVTRFKAAEQSSWASAANVMARLKGLGSCGGPLCGVACGGSAKPDRGRAQTTYVIVARKLLYIGAHRLWGQSKSRLGVLCRAWRQTGGGKQVEKVGLRGRDQRGPSLGTAHTL